MNRLANATLESLAAPAARTSTLTGSSVDLRDYEGPVAFVLDSAAGTGTTPTMDGKIQDSADGSTGWADVTGLTFAQVTNAAASLQTKVADANNFKRYVRAVLTIAGTTPSFTCSLHAVGVKKSV